MKKLISMAVVTVLLSACAYNAPVTVSPNLNVYSSYGDKLPGAYALYIEDDEFTQKVHATGYNCSAHSYPIDMTGAFRESTVKTIEQLVEEVDVVQSPMTADEMRRSGKRGQIIVRADSMTARVEFIPGFWSATAEADIDLTAALSVDGPDGRLLGTTAEGEGHAQGGAGVYCGGGAQVMADAAEKATKKLLGEMGERLSNSPRLRTPLAAQQSYAPSAPPPGPAATRARECKGGLRTQDPNALQC
jgi:hypothetical protein